MRIAQIVLPDASQYERKSQRADAAALAGVHEVQLTTLEAAAAERADVAHVYAGRELPAARLVRFPLPYVASADVPPSRWRLRRPVAPEYVVSPLFPKGESGRLQPLPEAVEDAFFAATARPPSQDAPVIGSFARPALKKIVEQTVSRIARFRSEVTWNVYEHAPSADDLASVDLWVDPVMDESDFDGFTAEALVVGLPVVASRTAINVLRLEQGRTGMLVPPGDPNELTHAILTMLFKREIAEGKRQAARQTVSKFRARQRLRILLHMYDTVTP